LGIKTISWAAGGRYLAIGGWDGKVRIVESEGWRCVGLMSWGTRINEKTVVRTGLCDGSQLTIRLSGKNPPTGSRILEDEASFSVSAGSLLQRQSLIKSRSVPGANSDTDSPTRLHQIPSQSWSFTNILQCPDDFALRPLRLQSECRPRSYLYSRIVVRWA
jgi:hypothetical protein